MTLNKIKLNRKSDTSMVTRILATVSLLCYISIAAATDLPSLDGRVNEARSDGEAGRLVQLYCNAQNTLEPQVFYGMHSLIYAKP